MTKATKKKPKVVCTCPVEGCEGGPWDAFSKFTAHWNLRHAKELGSHPPRAEVERFVGQPQEEEGGYDGEEEAGADHVAPSYGEGIPNVSYETLSDDPIKRLATILDVHQVPQRIRNSIVSIANLHPGYTSNPTNLYYLLLSKLERKFHQSIPLILQEFSYMGEQDPMANPPLMLLGGNMQGMPGMPQMPMQMNMPGQPFGYPQQFYQQPYPQPAARPESGAKSGGEQNSMKEMIMMLGALAKTMNEMGGGGGGKGLDETLKTLQTTLDDITKASARERQEMIQRFDGQIKQMQEDGRKAQEELKDKLHETEKNQLEQRIAGLTQARAEEMSEGLGSLVEGMGEAVGGEMQGVRETVSQGLDKIADIAKEVITAPGRVLTGGKQPAGEPTRTLAEASAIMELEGEIEQLSNELILEAQGVGVEDVEQALAELG